ncbi:hypothetical protein [Actinoplanes solisilvae]|uniref:hypothetical protein n=1 Tax=Actinoplanes solisilvae TaxID=2486853 RepID=UPI000FD7B4BA|nr:hypothetical protein [Actinoplanes solisilvae]
MGVGLSDAVFKLDGACVHSLRFSFGAPLGYPSAPALPDGADSPPALFRRIQVASPPPTRGGEPWQNGMKLAGQPFEPGAGADKLAEVVCDEGIPSLDAANPETVVLDEWFRVEKQEATVDFPGEDHGRYLLAIGYWSPIPQGQPTAQKTVAYYGDRYEMEWTRPVAVGDWVAVSFDAFFPPERDSSDVIIPITECDCP